MKKKTPLLAVLSGAVFLLISPLTAQDVQVDSDPIWHLSPGDRAYLTTDYAEKGLAYNPSNDHLYLVRYDSTAGTASVHILDADTGADLGELSTTGISGGTQLLRKIVVSDDGIIYAGNLTTNAASSPFKLYRWENEGSDPEVVWEGDPSNGESGVIRGYGGNLAIRGGAGTTQILAAPDYWQQATEEHVTAVFSTFDGGETFVPEFVRTEATTRFGLGTAFGEGDTFWGSRAGQPLREFDFDGNLLREFNSAVVTAALSPIDIHVEEGLLAGVASRQLWVYDLTTLDTEDFNTPLATRPFPTTNANIEATGALAFSDDVIYALDTNNGIVAYGFGPPPPPEPVEPGDLYWTNAAAIRTAEADGSNPRTVVGNLLRPIGIDIDPDAGHVYWAEDGNSAAGAGRIMRANLDGTEITPILTARTTPQFLKFNPENDRLYWAEFSSGLFSIAADGTDLRHLLDLSSASTTGVVLDLENDFVYLGTAGGQLYRYEIGSAYPTTPAPLSTLASDTYGIALGANNLLWATSFSGNNVYTKDLSTFTENPAFEGLGAPLGIASNEDGSQVAWVERTNGRVRIANVGEPTFQTLVEGEDSPFGIVIRPSGSEGFASWIAAFAIAEGENGATDDPDGDGISNLLEFALGLDPSSANRSSLPQPQTIEAAGIDYLVLEVNKNDAAAGVTLIVESSADLENWNSGEGHTVLLEESASLLRVRDAVAIGDGNRRFLRVRAESQ